MRKPLPQARPRRGYWTPLMDAAALALLLAWLLFALGALYPRYLSRTAPEAALPWIATAREQAQAALAPGLSPEGYAQAYALRDALWQRALFAAQGTGAAAMFCLVWLWRLHLRLHALPYGRQALRALHTCRLAGLCILLVQLALAYATWQVGLRHVEGRTPWDFLCALGCYPLTYLCSIPLRRLGAPAAYCARRGRFKRL